MSKIRNSVNRLEMQVREMLATIMRGRPDEDLTKADIVRLARESKQIPQDWLDGIHERALGKEIGRILRSETFTTEHGTALRKYHCYQQFVQTNGKETQTVFWRDIHTMNRRQILACLRGRTALAKDIMKQAKATCDYWNAHVAPGLKEKPIQKRLFE